jgi:hypothetical protein
MPPHIFSPSCQDFPFIDTLVFQDFMGWDGVEAFGVFHPLVLYLYLVSVHCVFFYFPCNDHLPIIAKGHKGALIGSEDF